MLQKIKGHTHLMRDKRTGAILNMDRAGISQARSPKISQQQQVERINNLEKEIADIKSLLSQIAEKL